MKRITRGIIVALVGLLPSCDNGPISQMKKIPEMNRWYDRNAERIGREFGFSHGTPYLRFGKHVNETFTFEQVNPTGLVGRAGIRSGDIIVSKFPWPTTGGLYRYFDENRGHTIAISVVEGGDGPPLKERRITTYKIDVPNNTSDGIRQPADGLPKPSR